MSKTVRYEDFDIISVETDGKKVKVVFFDKQQPNIEWPPKGFDVPHPDLMDALKDNIGREVMATSLCLLNGYNHARNHIKANEEATKAAVRGYNEEILRCDVRKLSFTGEDESAGLKIKGVLECDGARVPLETPHFIFVESDDELAERAKTWAEKVRKEVWAYLFKNKKSQQSLGLDEPKEEEGSKPQGGLNIVKSA